MGMFCVIHIDTHFPHRIEIAPARSLEFLASIKMGQDILAAVTKEWKDSKI